MADDIATSEVFALAGFGIFVGLGMSLSGWTVLFSPAALSAFLIPQISRLCDGVPQ